MALAQEVIVNVTPVQEVLPPQVMLYIADPGKYFNISLTNTSSQPQDVYLSLQVQQVSPASGLTISTPSKRQPATPFTVPANGVKQLTMTEIKTMFNHIPSNEIMGTPGLVGDYMNGSFGLLPEGQYKAVLTAYRWTKPQLAKPVVASNPMGGTAFFTVCYKAQAPQFLMPMATGMSLEESNVASLDALNPMFTWTQPIVTCNPALLNYKYSIKIVEVLKNQHPVEAIERNPVVYKRDNLMAPQCIIPQNVLTTQFYTDRTYAAQVTATSTTGGALNYVMIENEGKSTYRLFKIKTSDNGDDNGGDDKGGDKGGDKGDDNGDSQEDDDDGDGIFVIEGLSGAVDPDSLYTFSYPKIEKPIFSAEGGARKMFTGAGMKVEWIASSHLGGEGDDPNSIEIAYDVEMFRNDNFDLEAALASQPIYKNRTTELEDSIPWDNIKDDVETGNYLVLRVNPVVVKGESVAFGGDKKNVKDFALVELLSKKFFQCSNMIDITNTKPTTKKAADYKGKTIPIGQYQLTIDEINEGSKKNTFQGKGHVLWEPFGFEVGVCVKFSELEINTDDIVIAGTAESYSNDESMSDIQVVDKLFSDWGIDNLIADTGIPYANELQEEVGNKVKDIAKQIDLKKYYGYVKKGGAIVDFLTTGKIKDLYMPLSLPKSINKSPVDIQIVGMKFAATHATMDIVGQFTLPNTSYTKNDILVLGAPRICISPDRLLPESGTIALLSDFTINDPKSSYEMTFKAPKNVIEPEDGCYVSWHADKFEVFGIDLDMKIPGLVKDVNGEATNDKPVLNARASVSSWDDWMIDNVTIDPFQATALPGWTFTASDIVYDHSLYRNSTKMGAFPTGYNKSKAGIVAAVTDEEGKSYSVGDKSWQGLYIKEIAIKFPKALEFGTTGDKRLNISAKNMFFDKSGASLDISAGNVLSAKTGKAGGWAFSLDKVYLSFLQSDFSKCGFSGKFAVPLLKGEIAYDCKINRMSTNPANVNQYAYVFKTKQVDGLSLDFFLGQATFKKEQTYFLLESKPSGSAQDTKVELVLGGDITIGGTDYLNKKIKDSSLPIKFEIPGVHFCGMRLANCPNTWTSTYESALQKSAKNAKLSGIQLYAGKEIQFASGKVYFHTGKWSLASGEKKIGPFEFTLNKYDFSYSNKKLTADFEGTIKLISGVEVSATAGLAISANVTLPSDLTKLNDISISYGSTEFKKADINSKFAGMELSGSLTVEKGDKTKEGYTGELTFKMPGDLFSVKANGGYYKYESGATKYTYGYFVCKMASNVGIEITPVKITGITGGFYYNCKKNGDGATPVKGLIGVIAGIDLATTAGKEALSANMDMTVIYDSNNDRMSSFIFNGKVQAVSGLVNANANLVYENSNTDKYLQLDITIDASADGEKLINQMTGGEATLQSLKKQLNSSYTSLTKKIPTGSLQAMNDSQSKPDPSKQSKDKQGESLAVGPKVNIGLQFKMTWKEKGQKFSKAKWHLYIGEPGLDKRCQFTFLKFKSKVVSVDIGANAYLCLGNELPNNGKLPAIPDKVANFLNGSGSGKGIESASLSEANRARESSLKDFEDQITSIGGGVMFGAQVYGYLDVDLGIFYLNAGATAGFDISITKLPSTARCTNLSGMPGYNGWYGYGQLYAYLYAKFGIRLNLGFWKHDFDVCDAGIGGLFQMQGPKPSHFEGKARVKLKLLGGLVNVDRRFSFECGQGCDLFYGNALDNFRLFGDLSIGYDNSEQGWNIKNAIDPTFLQRPYFTTEAPLNEPFRVLDETEKKRLEKNFTGDKAALDMEASRTFIFRSNVGAYVTLEEWNASTSTWTKRSISIKGQNRYANYLDITSLTPNKHYRMTVTGYAKEIQNGTEVDPLKYDESTNKYYNQKWSQSKTYYFRTGPSKTVEDCPSDADFEKLVAIAYPSYYNKVKDYGGGTITSYVNDVKYPNIAFYSDVSKKIFQKGKLKWRLLKNNKVVSEKDAKWVVGANPACCNLTVASALSVTSDVVSRLCLDYEVSKTVNGKAQITTTRIVDLNVYPLNGHWQTGSNGKSLAYEKPFIGSSICGISYENTPKKVSDYSIAHAELANVNGKNLPYRLMNPYMYISYLSNYVFPGGWKFSTSRLDANITTCQSIVYTDKGGVYEGKLATGNVTYNIYEGYETIRKLSTFTYDQYSKFTEYPLPALDEEKYGYTLPGMKRVPVYTPGAGNPIRVKGYIIDLWYPVLLCYRMSRHIQQLLDLDFDEAINVKYKGMNWSNDIDAIKDWYQRNRGWYITQTVSDDVALQLPAYQLPIVYGSCLKNTSDGDRKKVTLWGTLEGYEKIDSKNALSRGHRENCLCIFSGLIGKENIGRTDGDISSKDPNMHSWDDFNTANYGKFINSAKFDIYRVNTYDYNKCCYSINSSLLGETPREVFTLSNPMQYYNNWGK